MASNLNIRIRTPKTAQEMQNRYNIGPNLAREEGNQLIDLLGGLCGGSKIGVIGVDVDGLNPNAIAPSLIGSAATYAALAHSAITNTGSTVLTGNIGIYPNTASSITGFPPGTFSGTENAANAAAAQAQADAQAGYTAMQARTATVIATALDAQTLTPGTYRASSGTFSLAASAPGTLTLNGPGIYVFQTASTLVTGSGGAPTITLTNGATAANVYFVVGSSATLNSGTAGTFNGNVIAQASITDTQGGVVNGSLVALTGAVTYSAATVGNVQLAPASTTVGGNPAYGTFTLSSSVSTDTVSVAGVVFTEVASGAQGTAASGTFTLSSSVSGDTVSINGKTYTELPPGTVLQSIQTIPQGSTQLYYNFDQGASDTATAVNLAAAINSTTNYNGFYASSTGAVVTVTSVATGVASNLVPLVSSAHITPSGAFMTGGTAPNLFQFNQGATDTATATNLAAAINANPTIGSSFVTSSSGAVVTVTSHDSGVAGNYVPIVGSSHITASAATLSGGVTPSRTVYHFGL